MSCDELGKVVERRQVRSCSVLSRAGCAHTSQHSPSSGPAHSAEGSVSPICPPITACRATTASDEKEQGSS